MSKRTVHEMDSAAQVLPAVALLESLIRALSIVEETRHDKGLRHPIINVLTIAVLGCMCGCDDAEALEDWGEKESDWLSDFLHLPHGTPSQDVFLRVFAALDPTSFRMAFHAWMQEVFSVLGLEGQIAIDGQTHRRSGDKSSGKKPLHMVHALMCEAGLVLGQVATDEKSNEIVAIPALLVRSSECRVSLPSLTGPTCSMIIAVVSAAQFIIGGDAVFGVYQPETGGRHIVIPFVNANHAGGFFAAIGFLHLGLSLQVLELRRRWLMVALASLPMLLVIASASRGAITAMIVGAFGLFFFMWRLGKLNKQQLGYAVAITLILGAVAFPASETGTCRESSRVQALAHPASRLVLPARPAR